MTGWFALKRSATSCASPKDCGSTTFGLAKDGPPRRPTDLAGHGDDADVLVGDRQGTHRCHLRLAGIVDAPGCDLAPLGHGLDGLAAQRLDRRRLPLDRTGLPLRLVVVVLELVVGGQPEITHRVTPHGSHHSSRRPEPSFPRSPAGHADRTGPVRHGSCSCPRAPRPRGRRSSPCCTIAAHGGRRGPQQPEGRLPVDGRAIGRPDRHQTLDDEPGRRWPVRAAGRRRRAHSPTSAARRWCSPAPAAGPPAPGVPARRRASGGRCSASAARSGASSRTLLRCSAPMNCQLTDVVRRRAEHRLHFRAGQPAGLGQQLLGVVLAQAA